MALTQTADFAANAADARLPLPQQREHRVGGGVEAPGNATGQSAADAADVDLAVQQAVPDLRARHATQIEPGRAEGRALHDRQRFPILPGELLQVDQHEAGNAVVVIGRAQGMERTRAHAQQQHRSVEPAAELVDARGDVAIALGRIGLTALAGFQRGIAGAGAIHA